MQTRIVPEDPTDGLRQRTSPSTTYRSDKMERDQQLTQVPVADEPTSPICSENANSNGTSNSATRDESVVYIQDGNTPSREPTDVVNVEEKEQPPRDTKDFNVMYADSTPTQTRQDSPRQSFCLREDLEEKQLLTIGTFNVKNIETNEIYIRELVQSCAIFAIQDHWLFSFQLGSIETNFVSHHAFSKAVDDNDPLPPNQKPRGNGGVSILFRRNMGHKVKKLIHGENRIVVIEVQSSPLICICNVYMPSRNSR